MTPHEKAKQLIEKITETLQDADMYGWYNPACKNCALIAVDEILYEFDHLAWHDDDYADYKMKYWKEVKQEIEKL